MGFFSDNPVTPDASKAQAEYAPLPEGKYKLVVEKSEEGRSKKGNAMLKLTFAVEDGEYAGRKLFANINLQHENPKVVAIGTAQLHSLLAMVGFKDNFTDAGLIVGMSCEAKVKISKREDTGAMVNEVLFAIPKTTEAASAPAVASTPTKAAAPANQPAKGKSDW